MAWLVVNIYSVNWSSSYVEYRADIFYRRCVIICEAATVSRSARCFYRCANEGRNNVDDVCELITGSQHLVARKYSDGIAGVPVII